MLPSETAIWEGQLFVAYGACTLCFVLGLELLKAIVWMSKKLLNS
ncbi:hypothetical protein UFOVP75_81 [uncultured Caudovirales phage]|uniref:Uncharacterized protein n=1 Tax=uncultured Caudovirales phage TaxID=2100421 RepID=A0A6J5L5P2_9CAUD|nr:hypothetical protein UFOVP75_81 [uncultured Caudovirales phage]